MKRQSGYLHHIYVPNMYDKYHDPSSSGSEDILFTMSSSMPKSEKGNNSVKYSQDFTKS